MVLPHNMPQMPVNHNHLNPYTAPLEPTTAAEPNVAKAGPAHTRWRIIPVGLLYGFGGLAFLLGVVIFIVFFIKTIIALSQGVFSLRIPNRSDVSILVLAVGFTSGGGLSLLAGSLLWKRRWPWGIALALAAIVIYFCTETMVDFLRY